MERVRKISNSLMKPVLGDRDRDRERLKEAERERERQLIRDWKDMNTRQGAILARSTSNPTKSKAPLLRSTSNPTSSKTPAAPPRPVIRHPEPVTDQSSGKWPSREELARLQEERRRQGYGPLRDPNNFEGVPAGPHAKAEVRRSSSMSQLPSYVPFLARKPKMMDEADLARCRAEAKEREERYQKELAIKMQWRDMRPEWDDPNNYPPRTEQDKEHLEKLKATWPGKPARREQEEKAAVKTRGGATISPPIRQGRLDADAREDSYTKPRAVPQHPSKPSSSSKERRSPSQAPTSIFRSLRRSSSELRLQDLLQEQQRLAREHGDAQRTADWKRDHQRRPSHDVSKPTVPLKVHKKSSSADVSVSSPAALATSRRSAESDRRADDRDHQRRDPSTHSSHRRGPPLSHSAQYSEPYFTAPPGAHGAKNVAKKKSSRNLPAGGPQDPHARDKPPLPVLGIYAPGAPDTPMDEIARIWAMPVTSSPQSSLSSLGSPFLRPGLMSLSPPRMERQLSDESSGSSRSRHYTDSSNSSPAHRPGPVPRATPRRQNTAPQPAAGAMSPPAARLPLAREPVRKPSSTSVAERRERSIDRIVIFPTDPYGVPLQKDLPDTPSLYTPTNYGPPSPTTKPAPPLPKLPATVRVGTSAMLNTPLSTLRLSPGMQLKDLGGQHTVEVSKPRGSVLAVSGFTAEIVSDRRTPSSSRRHEHREPRERSDKSHRERSDKSHRERSDRSHHERSDKGHHERSDKGHRERSDKGHHERSESRGRHERREERPAADLSQHVKRVYIPPAHAMQPPTRHIYAPPSAVDRTRAEPSTAYGSRSPPATTSTLKSKRSDYGNLYGGYSRPY